MLLLISWFRRFTIILTTWDWVLIVLNIIVWILFFTLSTCEPVKSLQYKALVKGYDSLKTEVNFLTTKNNKLLIRVNNYKAEVNVTNDTIAALTERVNSMTVFLDEQIKDNKLAYTDLVTYKILVENLREAIINSAVEIQDSIVVLQPTVIKSEDFSQISNLDKKIKETDEKITKIWNTPIQPLGIVFQTQTNGNKSTHILSEIDKIFIDCEFNDCYFKTQTLFLYLINPEGRNVVPGGLKKNVKQDGVRSYIEDDKIVIVFSPGVTKYVQETKVGKLMEGDYYIELRFTNGQLAWKTEPITLVSQK